MAKTKRGTPLNGWINLDKPIGLSSTQAMARVRKIMNAQKAGHGGTLDPFASGVLPIALGEATKTVSHVMDGTKTYVFELAFGSETDTCDTEGKVIATSEKIPNAEEIKNLLPQFCCEIKQVPPRFSALKIDGKRAYDLARAGEEFELEERIVTIYRFEFTGFSTPHLACFEVDCSKGTYIRSLARDLAKALGSCGHAASLRRTACGYFGEKNAISLDKLEALGHIAAVEEILFPIEAALAGIPAITLNRSNVLRITQGQTLLCSEVSSSIDNISLACAMCDNKLVALIKIEDGKIRPIRVINLEN